VQDLPLMNRKALLAVLVAGVGLAAAATWAWRNEWRAVDPDRLTLYGNVDIRQVSLAFNASERIAELRAREGERVRAGEVLGTLDMRTARVRLVQAQAQIGAQEQVLLRLKAGSRAEEIAQARANVAAAEAEAGLAAQQAARLKATAEATAGKGVSQQDLDNALARQKVTAARRKAPATRRNCSSSARAGKTSRRPSGNSPSCAPRRR
jgi:HlyD family secretion protein